MTGPSAIESVYGTPISTTAAPATSAARIRSHVVARSGNPDVKYGSNVQRPTALAEPKRSSVRLVLVICALRTLTFTVHNGYG
jgi:hypothetical protein